jgi:hypothetical protein
MKDLGTIIPAWEEVFWQTSWESFMQETDQLDAALHRLLESGITSNPGS